MPSEILLRLEERICLCEAFKVISQKPHHKGAELVLVMLRALALHQILNVARVRFRAGLDAICGVRFLIFCSALRGFSPGSRSPLDLSWISASYAKSLISSWAQLNNFRPASTILNWLPSVTDSQGFFLATRSSIILNFNCILFTFLVFEKLIFLEHLEKKKNWKQKHTASEGNITKICLWLLLNIERSFATWMFPPTAAVNEITHKNKWQSKALTLNNLISAKFKEKICK